MPAMLLPPPARRACHCPSACNLPHTPNVRVHLSTVAAHLPDVHFPVPGCNCGNAFVQPARRPLSQVAWGTGEVPMVRGSQLFTTNTLDNVARRLRLIRSGRAPTLIENEERDSEWFPRRSCQNCVRP